MPFYIDIHIHAVDFVRYEIDEMFCSVLFPCSQKTRLTAHPGRRNKDCFLRLHKALKL